MGTLGAKHSKETRWANQTPVEVEQKILEWQADGVPILEIKRRIEAEYDRTISRQTIYNILGRFGVKRTRSEAKYQALLKDVKRLNRITLRFINGSTDRPTMLDALSDFQARWED